MRRKLDQELGISTFSNDQHLLGIVEKMINEGDIRTALVGSD
jgi:hypothetical protein